MHPLQDGKSLAHTSVLPKREPGQGLRYPTKSLIYELNGYDPSLAYFTLMDDDVVVRVEPSGDTKTLLSLRRAYIECRDPQEGIFASRYFYSYAHWIAVSELLNVREEVAEWRRELEMILKSEALKIIVREAEEDGKNAYEANKFLLTSKFWDKEDKTPKGDTKRGRPSKAEIAARLQEETDLEKRLKADMQRINVSKELN